MRKTPLVTIFSIDLPRRTARHSSALALSLLLHSAVFMVVVFGVTYSHPEYSKRNHTYAVRLIRLQLSKPVFSTQLFRNAHKASRRRAVVPRLGHHTRLAKQTLIRRRRARWRRDYRDHTRLAKQTLIRPDVPPNVLLKKEIPIPAILPQGMPHSLAPPSSQQAAAANLVSIPDTPLRAADLIVVPPANQTAQGRLADPRGSVSSVGPTAQSRGKASTAGLTRITQPEDGKFGVVVTGSSASDLYPDSAGVLSGRVVYTVYVRVGLHKNWILQHCLPKGSEQGGAAVDAPWPVVILRPDELSALDFDYIIVHGIINSTGRFEQLGLVYPSELPEQEKLLGALRQWRFRSARQGGQAVAVEALLVISRQEE
jgi:hypothetical protein